MPYYEYKGKISRVEHILIPRDVYNYRILNNTINDNNAQYNNNFVVIYFKIAKNDVKFRNKFAYLPCLTYNGYPNKIPVAGHFINDNKGLRNDATHTQEINPLPDPLPLNDLKNNGNIEINPDTDGKLPEVKLCLLYKINEEHYLRIFVPINNHTSNIVQLLKTGVTVEVVFLSELHPASDNTAASIRFVEDSDF